MGLLVVGANDCDDDDDDDDDASTVKIWIIMSIKSEHLSIKRLYVHVHYV